jgi:transcriptional regulator with XRE-family HTH domain
MNTQRLLLQNLRILIEERRVTQRKVAAWVGHHETWLSKILREERGLSLEEIDKLAEFFGLTGYQLCSPGISSMTERRRGDRRSGRERRHGDRRQAKTTERRW